MKEQVERWQEVERDCRTDVKRADRECRAAFQRGDDEAWALRRGEACAFEAVANRIAGEISELLYA